MLDGNGELDVAVYDDEDDDDDEVEDDDEDDEEDDRDSFLVGEGEGLCFLFLALGASSSSMFKTRLWMHCLRLSSSFIYQEVGHDTSSGAKACFGCISYITSHQFVCGGKRTFLIPSS